MKPGESVTLDVPDGAKSLILSGANVPMLKRGTVVAHVGITPIRIGEISDWGSLRREHYYNSRNTLPANPAGLVRGYGYEAWIDGAARFPVAGRRVTITTEPRLPANALLQVEGFE
jgi:hypothetical protein